MGKRKIKESIEEDEEDIRGFADKILRQFYVDALTEPTPAELGERQIECAWCQAPMRRIGRAFWGTWIYACTKCHHECQSR